MDPDAGSWAASYISTLHVSLPETSERERYVACAMCAKKQAKKGDLCRDCWRWTRTVDEALREHWKRHHLPGKSKRDPIVISSDDEDSG